MLPSDGSHYGFDMGLVLMSADARRFVVRGPELKAVLYVPQLPPTPEPERMANGRERIVPLLPIGDVPARQLVRDGQWLGLYSEKEAPTPPMMRGATNFAIPTASTTKARWCGGTSGRKNIVSALPR